MKKKGFTLVELLAVIAILAILVIIALPNVLGMFNSAKKSTFITEVQSIFKQAQTDFVSDSITSTGPKIYCDTSNYTDDGADGKTANIVCTSNPIELTTAKNYYVNMTSSGAITSIVVVDGSFVYVLNDDTGIKVTDIKDDDHIKEYAKSIVNWTDNKPGFY